MYTLREETPVEGRKTKDRLFGIWKDNNNVADVNDFIDKLRGGRFIKMADSLIGSTASVLNKPLLTGNVKHYKMLKGVNLKKF